MKRVQYHISGGTMRKEEAETSRFDLSNVDSSVISTFSIGFLSTRLVHPRKDLGKMFVAEAHSIHWLVRCIILNDILYAKPMLKCLHLRNFSQTSNG